MKVVIIDDDPTTRALLAKIIESENHRAVPAASGEEGLQIIRQQKVHAVFCDLILPGLSGLDVLKSIRERPVTKSLPVVMISASGGKAEILHAAKLGISGYLRKPVQPYNIIPKLRALEKEIPPVLRPAADTAEKLGLRVPNFLELAAAFVAKSKARIQDATAALAKSGNSQARLFLNEVTRAASNIGAESLYRSGRAILASFALADTADFAAYLNIIAAELDELQTHLASIK